MCYKYLRVCSHIFLNKVGLNFVIYDIFIKRKKMFRILEYTDRVLNKNSGIFPTVMNYVSANLNKKTSYFSIHIKWKYF